MDAAQLCDFSPFNTLESANLADLLDSIEILQATQGQVLSEKGDTEKRS
jgi:hypothetical protein